MAAKMVGKPHRSATRRDWDVVRVDVMRWCLRVKLAQNWRRFGQLLLATDEKEIVEESRRDDFWGAKPSGHTLVGKNVLGRLLMELRQEARDDGDNVLSVDAPRVSGLLIDGRLVGPIREAGLASKDPMPKEDIETASEASQTTLFPDEG